MSKETLDRKKESHVDAVRGLISLCKGVVDLKTAEGACKKCCDWLGSAADAIEADKLREILAPMTKEAFWKAVNATEMSAKNIKAAVALLEGVGR